MDKAPRSAQSKEAWHAAHGQAWQDRIDRTRLEKLRKANRKRDAEQWADVDDLIEREAARRAAAGPRDFGAPVPWTPDPGPERF